MHVLLYESLEEIQRHTKRWECWSPSSIAAGCLAAAAATMQHFVARSVRCLLGSCRIRPPRAIHSQQQLRHHQKRQLYHQQQDHHHHHPARGGISRQAPSIESTLNGEHFRIVY